MPLQIKRLILIFAVLVGLFVVARHFLIPKSFGKYGHYRADAVDDVASLPARYASATVCTDCHSEIYKKKQNSRHNTVACETCHGPSLTHTTDPMTTKPVKPSGRDFCALCHSADTARPSSMKQIDIDNHNPGVSCTTCHNPHDPNPRP